MSKLARLMLCLMMFVPGFAIAQSQNERTVSYDFPVGKEIRMNLSAGEYKIRGTSENHIRVTWSSEKPKEVERVEVSFSNRSQAKLETNHTKGVHVTIEVPSRSDLDVHLSAGELHVKDIEGNKDLQIGAGELEVRVDDFKLYKDVHSSVSIGEINAEPLGVSKGGFFRGFTQSGAGVYSLRAKVGIGEVRIIR